MFFYIRALSIGHLRKSLPIINGSHLVYRTWYTAMLRGIEKGRNSSRDNLPGQWVFDDAQKALSVAKSPVLSHSTQIRPR